MLAEDAMPMFEFYCCKCGHVFEELCKLDEATPICPACGSSETRKEVSMPSPLKTGAFPFKPKPGDIHPLAKKMASAQYQPSPCSACGQKCS